MRIIFSISFINNINVDICRDNQIRLQFDREIHANTDSFVSRFSPNFENREDYGEFYVNRKKEDEERQKVQRQIENKREAGKKRKLIDDNDSCNNTDNERQYELLIM